MKKPRFQYECSRHGRSFNRCCKDATVYRYPRETKSPRNVAKKPPPPKPGSLRAHENEWMRAMLNSKQASGEAPPLVKMFAKLSHDIEALNRRMLTAESLLFTMATGMVQDSAGRPHLFGCDVREGKKCSCGSVPRKEQG